MRDRLNLAIGLVIETSRALASMTFLVISIPLFQVAFQNFIATKRVQFFKACSFWDVPSFSDGSGCSHLSHREITRSSSSILPLVRER